MRGANLRYLQICNIEFLNYKVAFLEKTVERVETILERLTIVGIGKRSRSSVRY